MSVRTVPVSAAHMHNFTSWLKLQMLVSTLCICPAQEPFNFLIFVFQTSWGYSNWNCVLFHGWFDYFSMFQYLPYFNGLGKMHKEKKPAHFGLLHVLPSLVCNYIQISKNVLIAACHWKITVFITVIQRQNKSSFYFKTCNCLNYS